MMGATIDRSRDRVPATGAGLPPARIAQLRAALSSALMPAQLERHWRYARRRGLRVLDCQLTRVVPRPTEDTLIAEFAVRLADGQAEFDLRLLGEIGDGDAIERCRMTVERLWSEEAQPLAGDDPSDFVWSVPDLGMVLCVAGVDESALVPRLLQDPALSPQWQCIHEKLVEEIR